MGERRGTMFPVFLKKKEGQHCPVDLKKKEEEGQHCPVNLKKKGRRAKAQYYLKKMECLDGQFAQCFNIKMEYLDGQFAQCFNIEKLNV